MRTSTTPTPGPLCAAFAPLLPLISSSALEPDEAISARAHLAGCAWCQAELGRFTRLDDALRRQFGAESVESPPPLPFDLDRNVGDEEYAFTLEDTLEETITTERDPQSSATVRSSRWDSSRRGPSRRFTTIAAIAVALVLVVVAATIFGQFATRRVAHPTATPSVHFTKINLPNANARSIYAATTAPDGSLWLTAGYARGNELMHVALDGTFKEFQAPVNDNLKAVYTYGIAIGADSTVWFTGDDFDGSTYTRLVRRMAPDGVITTVPLPQNARPLQLVAGPDGAIWFAGYKELNPANPTSESRTGMLGRIVSDGTITEISLPSQSNSRGEILSLCVGPDQAIWYTRAPNPPIKQGGRIGRVSSSGQAEEFAVSSVPGTLVSGSDGALWFTEIDSITLPSGETGIGARAGYVGRMTTAGVTSELHIDPSVHIGSLSSGSDGALWFSQDQIVSGASNAFGRITLSGNTTILTTGGPPVTGLVTGSGVVWLLDSQSNLWLHRL